MDDPERTKKLSDQDEDIFQTARLINCGWFAAIIFSDYLGSILGLVRQGSTWSLDPFAVRTASCSYSSKVLTIVYTQEIRESDRKLFERGRGNVCSVEVRTDYHSG